MAAKYSKLIRGYRVCYWEKSLSIDNHFIYLDCGTHCQSFESQVESVIRHIVKTELKRLLEYGGTL